MRTSGMDCLYWFISLCIAVIGAPLLPGIINRIKSFFAGRQGPSVFQLYRDMVKLLKKGTVLSTTSIGFVRLVPLCSIVGTFLALALLPLGLADSPLSFSGDVILFLYLLGMARLFTVLGALDTGSAFEGMGASRELQFSLLAEVAMLAVVIFLALLTNCFSLNGLLNSANVSLWQDSRFSLLLAVMAIYLILLCENCRVPFDDPETHLELTMIHEAMILDHNGPDLALIHYGAALKLWLFSALLMAMITPAGWLVGWLELFFHIIGVLLCAVLVGITESMMGRSRFLKVPQMLLSAFALGVSAIFLFLVFHR